MLLVGFRIIGLPVETSTNSLLAYFYEITDWDVNVGIA